MQVLVTRHTPQCAWSVTCDQRLTHAITDNAPLISFLSIMHNPGTGDELEQISTRLPLDLTYEIAAPYYLKTKAHVQQYRHRYAVEPHSTSFHRTPRSFSPDYRTLLVSNDRAPSVCSRLPHLKFLDDQQISSADRDRPASPEACDERYSFPPKNMQYQLLVLNCKPSAHHPKST